MRPPGESIETARRNYARFIADNLQSAQISQGTTTESLDIGALQAFAALLHAVTDETSPAHEGFQVWEWGDWCSGTAFPWLCDQGSVRDHIARESEISPQRLDRAVGVSIRWFLETFGSRFYWMAIGEKEPVGCVATSDSATGSKSKECK